MKPLQPGEIVGDYRVIEAAGSGGMGAVYKIEHVLTRRIEAMKLLPPGLSSDPEQVHRFEREIQVQARLHHPNIVTLYNALREGDSIALVMEFVEGESLQRKLEAGPLPVERAVDFTGQVLCALAYAHEAGVIHRDVAPANILITPEGIAKLMDFGLARGAADIRLSTSGVPVGSLWYMSPEQVRAMGPVDSRADIYALGAVLHEMLTGEKLFQAEGAFAVMRAHVEADPAPPSSRNSAVPAALDEIVRKAVAKDPAMRFQSAEEFRRELQRAFSLTPLKSPYGDAPAMAPAVTAAPLVASSMVASSMVATSSSRPRLSLAALLLALAPAALVAGFYNLRSHPAPVPVPASRPDAAPSAPLVRAEPQLAAAVPPATIAVEKEAPKPVEAVRHRAQPQATRRSVKPTPNSEIRVTGGEPQPPAELPAAVAVPRHTAIALDVPEPLIPRLDSVEAPAAELPPIAAPQDAVPPKPPAAGNRFVRALSKVNPFRRTRRDSGEAVKTLQKD